ncbi:capsid cement protein [uncultured Mycolicibacterium sp.]|uniref:capsid cement protein n=1 Tax=uncultured Mycolicibacterium sp. TaxID=2320817 RepID=UPI0032B1E262
MSTTITNPYSYSPGANITAEATADVTARRFVAISGSRTAAGNLAVAPAADGDRAFGVAADDASAGQLVHVARGGVVRVVAAGAIPAGADVQVGADGAASTAAAGVVVGFAVTGAADGAVAEVAFYA